MKPLALSLRAFGSYAGRFEVDFARLGRHGIFSITGPTGAGKSTIFDAIVYALYDDLPGFREDSNVRSQFADPGTRTEVTFSFHAAGEDWMVERSPEQVRPRTRGDGEAVSEPSRVCLKRAGEDGGGLTRKTAVATRLEELVGLSQAQFEQVVLIPQGKFEEVLKARTSDRAALLSRLFPVDVYRRVTEALKEIAGERADELRSVEGDCRRRIDAVRRAVTEALGDETEPDGVQVLDLAEPDLAQLDERCREVKALAARLEGEVAAAGSRQEAALAARQQVLHEIEVWEAHQGDLRMAAGFPAEEAADVLLGERVDRAKGVAALHGTLVRWRQTTADLAELVAAHQRLVGAVDTAWLEPFDRVGLASAGGCTALARDMSYVADQLDRAAKERAEILAGEQELGQHADELARARADADQKVRANKEATERLTALQKERDGLAGEAGRAEALRLRVQVAKQRLGQARELASLEEDMAKRESEVSAASARAVEASAHAVDVEAAWRAGLASRLAGSLEEGVPCPTCGSVDHPAPAPVDVDAMSDEDLDAARAAEARAREAMQKEQVVLSQQQGRRASLGEVPELEEVERELAAGREELGRAEAAAARQERLVAEVAQREADLDRAVAGVQQEKERLAAAEAGLDANRASWTGRRDAFVEAQGPLDAAASLGEQARAHRRLSETVAALAQCADGRERTESAHREQLADLLPAVERLGLDGPEALEGVLMEPEELAQAERDLQDRRDHRNTVSGRIRAYVEAGHPAEHPDNEPVRIALEEASRASQEAQRRFARVDERQKVIDRERAGLSDGTGAIQAARRVKEEAETLAAICAGRAGGPVDARVSLENWVLAYYLRQVLAQANVRLRTMTNGRYALVLGKEQADKRSQWGLDLSVLDAETGRERPASTLSGGETFQAALALALGLADVVSAGSDHHIGALFVDEGFGSLDEDALDAVIEVLRSLEEGGRMVGVISHVESMKAALPTGITVQSTGRGSAATVHYPDA